MVTLFVAIYVPRLPSLAQIIALSALTEPFRNNRVILNMCALKMPARLSLTICQQLGLSRRVFALLTVLTRQLIREVLDLLGPQTGVPTLKEMFPEVSRAELEHQLRL
jgi:hypothetical protein